MITQLTQQEIWDKLLSELIESQNDDLLNKFKQDMHEKENDSTGRGLTALDKHILQTIDIYFQAKDKAETLIREHISDKELEGYIKYDQDFDIINIYADVHNFDNEIQIRNIRFELLLDK